MTEELRNIKAQLTALLKVVDDMINSSEEIKPKEQVSQIEIDIRNRNQKHISKIKVI